MKKLITVKLTDGITPSQAIQAAVNECALTPDGAVVVPKINGYYEIDEAILLPSNVTVILDGAHLRLKDGIYDNVFRSANVYSDNTEEIRNVKLLGKNGAVIDGGKHNGLTEYNTGKDGLPHCYFNNLVLISNVHNYQISDISFINPRYWMINQLYCSYGVLKNIRFDADAVMPNQDGINLRVGCHHILIENVTGKTGDDTVALTAVLPRPQYQVLNKPDDIHHVTITNVKSCTHQTIVALRTSDGIKLHDIVIDGVTSTYNPDDENTFLPWGVVRVGEGLYYHERASKEGEIYNIIVKNVYANGKYGVALSNVITDSVFENVTAVGVCPAAIMTDFKWWTRYPDEGGGVTLKRCIFKDITYKPDSLEPRRIGFFETPVQPAAFLFKNMKKYNALENVYINGVNLPKGMPLMDLADGVSTDSLYISDVKILGE